MTLQRGPAVPGHSGARKHARGAKALRDPDSAAPDPTWSNMRTRSALSLLGATAALVLAGCASTPDITPPADAPDVSPAPAPAPASPAAPEEAGEGAQAGPVETYLAWLAASREPDAARACSMMTSELQQRMLDEFAATLGAQFPDCETMIVTTAEMYAATGASADVDVEVVSETAAEATLFATYTGSGKCGTIHLQSGSSGWVLTEQSEECVR